MPNKDNLNFAVISQNSEIYKCQAFINYLYNTLPSEDIPRTHSLCPTEQGCQRQQSNLTQLKTCYFPYSRLGTGTMKHINQFLTSRKINKTCPPKSQYY